MRLNIHIGTGNAAFTDLGEGRETARILQELGNRLEPVEELAAGDVYVLRDFNGNAVGEARVETD